MTSDKASPEPADFGSLDEVFRSQAVAEKFRTLSPTFHRAASDLWRAPFAGGHLTPRMRELVLFAMHVSATALNVGAVERQTKRIGAAGGTLEDIFDVLVTIASLASHALYSSLPILEEEWLAAGNAPPSPSMSDSQFETIKQRFIEIRGFWNKDREPLARNLPDYFAALTSISTISWQEGALTVKEREFICIGIDSTVTHSYPPGLRSHIRNAIKHGATREEIMDVFQLAGLMGLEGLVMTAEAVW